MLTVTVLGLGLIGGSLLRALAASGHQVRGYDAAPQTRTAAAAAAGPGVDWRIAGSVAGAVAGADVVVLAVPLPAIGEVLDQLAGTGYSGILTDVTSVKAPVQRLVYDKLPGARYVGGHPMAGKETSGFAASDPGLFGGCAWALTLDSAPGGGDPDSTGLVDEAAAPPGDPDLTGQVEEAALPSPDWLAVADLVTSLGSRVVPVTAAEHDTAVALVSHVPHLAAAAVAAGAGTGLAADLAAGSYRDGTRVAASRPPLVAAMCGGNVDAVRPALDELIDRLGDARRRLDSADPVASLTEWLAAGHRARTGWPPQPGPAAALPVTVAALLQLGRDGGWLTAVAADRRTVTAVRPAPRP
ncbi:MAG: prephenate dehydrogenase [Micromonosporaceae bacterium]